MSFVALVQYRTPINQSRVSEISSNGALVVVIFSFTNFKASPSSEFFNHLSLIKSGTGLASTNSLYSAINDLYLRNLSIPVPSNLSIVTF